MRCFILVFLMLTCACGGGSGYSSDESGFSTIQVFNSSNFSISVDCVSTKYWACEPQAIDPGTMHVVGVYGEIGAFPGPLPHVIFDEISVLYDVGEGEYLEGRRIEPADWVAQSEQEYSVTYVVTISDDDLLLE